MTRYLTTATPPENFVANYGLDWKPGVISEHVDLFTAAGGTVRQAASGSGAQWAMVGAKAYPVLCSEIIEIPTEDGPVSGRCGLRSVTHGACEGHAEVIEAYLATSEAERAHAERYQEA